MSDSTSNGTKPVDLPGSDDSSDDGEPGTAKPAGPPGAKKPAGPPGAKKPAGPPGSKKPAGPGGGKKPPGYGGRQEKTRSDTEGHKEGSDYLYAGLPEKLYGETDHFAEEQKEVLKHVGIYQQDDRDLRKKLENKHYYFFVRSKLPGGKMTADQWLVHDRLADEYGIGSIRTTTRQSIQIHGVVKEDLKAHLRELNEALVTTLGACGDVVRNTMCCPAPTDDPVRREIMDLAHEVADFTMPQSPAYHDVWLKEYDSDEQAVETIKKLHDGRKEDVETLEPLYGKAYLPRKFKVGFAYPGDNCVDVYTHDVGFVAVKEDGELAGFNVLVGGSLGNTHNKPKTFPRLGDLLGYVPKQEVIELVRSIILIQRENGNRKDRKVARMKYLIEDWGLEKFHGELEERFGRRLEEPREMGDMELELHEGWHEQGDGRHYLGLSVENGRVVDDGEFRLKTALRKVAEQFRSGFRLTPNHDILLTDLKEEDKEDVEALLREHNVKLPRELSNTQKYSMACPALPSCGLALTESERIFPVMIDRIEEEAAALGLEEEKFSVRMTGCPNGCARPYVADLGIVGQSLNKYKIYVGGRLDGTRLNEPYEELVDLEDVLPTVLPLLHAYRRERVNGESFGDFADRVGPEKLKSIAESVDPHEIAA